MANEAAVEAEEAQAFLPEAVIEQLPEAEPEPEISSDAEVDTPATSKSVTEPDVVITDELEEEIVIADEDLPSPTDENALTDEIATDEVVSDTEPVSEQTNNSSTETDLEVGSIVTPGQEEDEAAVTENETPQTETDPSPATTEDEQTTDDETPLENPSPSVSTGGSSAPDSPVASDDDLINNTAIEQGVTSLVDSVVNEVVTLTRQMVTEENFYQFSRQSCVAVGDGTFHCTSKEKSTIDPTSAVYAERDETGDMEIYMRTAKGDVKQLSDNDFDDTSPDMDLTSMRVVWQRLVDGRYQIISYDLEERKETQLTFSRTNNMEPKVAKEGVVWQAWDGNDWEIMFFDGQFTDQITDNELQDVTPDIEDGYVLWNVLGGKAAEARVYSIEGGEMMTITGHEGGAVVNPRFVLVYDTKFDNGDVITQGFDPVTGLATTLGAKPAELPFDIPEPDPVGEIRALIQNKSTQKDKEVITVPVTDSDSDLNLAGTVVSAPDTLDLNGQLDDDDDAIDLPATEEDNFELGEYDLVITDDASSTTSSLNRAYHLVGTKQGTSTRAQ